ncbi:MAG: dienelactone hydrolase [Steroidobacteraceae bacterium]|jgi:predicted dienelactone hydrolase
MAAAAVLLAILQAPMPAGAEDSAPAARLGVDAPELARLGNYAVGVRTLHLREAGQPDVLAFDAASGKAPLRVRELTVDLWYPAAPKPGEAAAVYSAQLPSEPPAPPATFSVTGLAVREAPAAGKGFPLVVVSHGYSNDPAAMIWLTENLASKGYVVAGIHHDDPPITDRSKFIGPLLRRPLDIAYVTSNLQRMLGAEQLIDPSRTALIGYSMGGYGVLTAAGAALDPNGPPTRMIPGALLMPYVRGGARAGDLSVRDLKAVVAISPAGGGTLAAWGAEGLRGLEAPLLLIQGDHDRTVDYATGAHAIFEGAVNAPRYLLTFLGAGHSIGLIPAPPSMRKRLWDQEWFEDPVWRAERVNAINAHFITAFLDRYLKGDESRAAYLDVAVPKSSDGVWPTPAPGSPPAPYDAYSPGSPGITVWKGFQHSEAAGLEMLRSAAGPSAPTVGEVASVGGH